MAYLQDFNDDEEQQGGQKTLTADNTVTGPTPANASAGAATPAPKVASGSGFVNFNKYIDANKEASGQMAGEVVAPIQQNIGKERTQRDTTTAAVSKAASENTIQDQGILSALQSDPTKVDKEAFKKQTGGYKGPASAAELTPYQDLTKIQATNQADVGMLGNAEGLESKLSQTYGKNPYTKGSRVLDTALTSGGQGGDILRGVQKDYSSLQPLSDLTSQFDKTLADARRISDDTALKTQQAFQTQLGQTKTKIGDAQQDLAKDPERQAQLLKDTVGKLQSNDISTLSEAGLGSDAAEFLKNYGYDLKNLVQAGPGRDLGDVVDADTQSRYSALAGLGDIAPEYVFNKTGNSAPGVQYNKGDIGKATELTKLLGQVSQQQSKAQQARDAEFAAAKALADKSALTGDIAGNAKKLGLSAEDYKFAVEQGLVTPDMFAAGKKLQIGDVGESVRPVYEQLAAALGLTGTPSLADTQDEGSAWTFNQGDLAGRIATRKGQLASDAERARVLANEQALQKIISGPSGGKSKSSIGKDIDRAVTTSSPAAQAIEYVMDQTGYGSTLPSVGTIADSVISQSFNPFGNLTKFGRKINNPFG